jgi:PAS domain S-box-containing protein
MPSFDDPETLRRVMEDLPTGVYLVGRDGKILFWNYGAERITGHLRQDVVGHACREDFLGDAGGGDNQVTAASAAAEAVLKDGKAAESQVSFRHKEGHLVPVRLRAIAMRDREGAIIGLEGGVCRFRQRSIRFCKSPDFLDCAIPSTKSQWNNRRT